VCVCARACACVRVCVCLYLYDVLTGYYGKSRLTTLSVLTLKTRCIPRISLSRYGGVLKWWSGNGTTQA